MPDFFFVPAVAVAAAAAVAETRLAQPNATLCVFGGPSLTFTNGLAVPVSAVLAATCLSHPVYSLFLSRPSFTQGKTVTFELRSPEAGSKTRSVELDRTFPSTENPVVYRVKVHVNFSCRFGSCLCVCEA